MRVFKGSPLAFNGLGPVLSYGLILTNNRIRLHYSNSKADYAQWVRLHYFVQNAKVSLFWDSIFFIYWFLKFRIFYFCLHCKPHKIMCTFYFYWAHCGTVHYHDQRIVFIIILCSFKASPFNWRFFPKKYFHIPRIFLFRVQMLHVQIWQQLI